MVGEQRAHHEGAQLAVHAGCLEQAPAQGDGDRHPEQRVQLPVADPVPDPVQRPGGGHQQDEGQRPRAGGLPGGHRHEDDGGDVLEHQQADGDPPVQRRRVGAVLQDLDHEDGGGEGQREAHESERAHRLVGEQGRADHREQPEEAQPHRGREHQVDGRRQPDLPAQQGARVELQPDREQQQHHAEVGQRVERGRAGHAEAGQDEPRDEEADQRRQAQQVGEQAAGHGHRQHEDQVERHVTSHRPAGLTLGAARLRCRTASGAVRLPH